jgi:hypothetical protein
MRAGACVGGVSRSGGGGGVRETRGRRLGGGRRGEMEVGVDVLVSCVCEHNKAHRGCYQDAAMVLAVACAFIDICAHTHTHTYTNTYTHTQTHTTHTNAHTHMCVYVYARMHICMYRNRFYQK